MIDLTYRVKCATIEISEKLRLLRKGRDYGNSNNNNNRHGGSEPL